MMDFLTLIIIVIDILVIVELVRSSKPPLQKVLWIILVCALPLIGVVIYYLTGGRRK